MILSQKNAGKGDLVVTLDVKDYMKEPERELKNT